MAKTRDTLTARPNVRTLQELEGELSGMLGRLRPWDEELDRQLAGLRAALQGLDKSAAVWQATAKVARREGAAGTTVTRIAAVRGEIDKARAALFKRRDQVLAVRDRLVDPSGALAASLEQVRESLREEWKAGGPPHLLHRLQEGGQYAREQVRMLGFQLVLFVALVLGLRSLRERARAWAEDDYNLRDAKEVFERPWAMALLIAVIFTTPLHPLAPRGAALVGAALVAVAALPKGHGVSC